MYVRTYMVLYYKQEFIDVLVPMYIFLDIKIILPFNGMIDVSANNNLTHC